MAAVLNWATQPQILFEGSWLLRCVYKRCIEVGLAHINRVKGVIACFGLGFVWPNPILNQGRFRFALREVVFHIKDP